MLLISTKMLIAYLQPEFSTSTFADWWVRNAPQTVRIRPKVFRRKKKGKKKKETLNFFLYAKLNYILCYKKRWAIALFECALLKEKAKKHAILHQKFLPAAQGLRKRNLACARYGSSDCIESWLFLFSLQLNPYLNPKGVKYFAFQHYYFLFHIEMIS